MENELEGGVGKKRERGGRGKAKGRTADVRALAEVQALLDGLQGEVPAANGSAAPPEAP